MDLASGGGFGEFARFEPSAGEGPLAGVAAQAGQAQGEHEARLTGGVGDEDHADGGVAKAGGIETDGLGSSQVVLDAQAQVGRERRQTATVTC